MTSFFLLFAVAAITYCVCGDQKKKLLKFLMSTHSSTRGGNSSTNPQASCTSTLSMRHGAIYSAHTERVTLLQRKYLAW